MDNTLKLYLNDLSSIALEDLTSFETYLRGIGGAFQQGNILLIGMAHNVEAFKPGKWIYKYIHDGIIASIEGLKDVQHYIQLPLSFSTTVAETKETTDEENNVITTVVTNKDKYHIHNENETHCLVRLTDDNYNELLTLIVYDEQGVPTNVYCNDKVDEVLNNYTINITI